MDLGVRGCTAHWQLTLHTLSGGGSPSEAVRGPVSPWLHGSLAIRAIPDPRGRGRGSPGD